MTVRYYNVQARLSWYGTAIQRSEPAVRGQVLTRVSDTTSLGARALLVVEASDEDHAANEGDPAIETLYESDAQRVADRYRPAGERRGRCKFFDTRVLEKLRQQSRGESIDLATLTRQLTPARTRARVELNKVISKIKTRN